MTNGTKNILFSSVIRTNVQDTVSHFNRIYSAMDRPADGQIISFLLDAAGEVISYQLHDNRLNSVFFGPSHTCVWYSDGADLFTEEYLPNGNVIRRLFRKLHAHRNPTQFLNGILNGREVTAKSLNYYTGSLQDSIHPFMQAATVSN